MVINNLSCRDFYERLKHTNNFKVVVTLVARGADAKQAYNEILEDWSSFHDLTGTDVAFVFAGDGQNHKTNPVGWQNSYTFHKIPDGFSIPNQSELGLQETSPHDFAYKIAESVNNLDIVKTQTIRIREIKEYLNINEEDIPCLHFKFVQSDKYRVIPLATIGNIYDYFKEVFNLWDKIFIQLSGALKDFETFVRSQSSETRKYNRVVRDAKCLYQKLENVVLFDTHEEYFIQELSSFLGTVQNRREDAQWRNDALGKMRVLTEYLKQGYDTQRHKDLLGDLNRIVDIAQYISVPPTNEQIALDGIHSCVDDNLIAVLDSHNPDSARNSINNLIVSKAITPLKAFISYSKFDGESSMGANYLEQFKKVMMPLSTYNNLIQTWDDTDLTPGEEWDDKISKELESSDIIFLLVSNNFLATDYIKNVELGAALRRHEANQCIVVPIVLSACGWTEIPMLARLNGLPRKGYTISSWQKNPGWHSIDDAWFHVFGEVKKLVAMFKYRE